MLTFKIVLYRQKTYKDGTHPVMLQTMENRKAKRISLGHACLPHQWDDAKGRFKKNFPNHELKNAELSQIESKGDTFLAVAKLQQRTVTVGQFFEEFQQKAKVEEEKKKATDVFAFFATRKSELHEQGKIGNKGVYHSCEIMLRSFHKSKSLPFSAVDYNFLVKVEIFLRTRGATDGGISTYMRTLRGLYNEAIRRGIVDKEAYPFSTQFNKNGYSIAKLRTGYSPRALSDADFEKFKKFSPSEYPRFRETWLMFLFAFYARGMSYSDLAYLKWADIYDGRLTYTRKKSKSKLTMKLHPKALEILEMFRSESMYVFPILSDFHKTPTQQRDRIIKARDKYNLHLKKIAQIVGMDSKLTSHQVRHTFATYLKRKGVSTAIIAQALGHAGEEVTRHYLQRFEDEDVDKTNDLL